MTDLGTVGASGLLDLNILTPVTNISNVQTYAQIPTKNQIFSSMDTGAPTLSGSAGALTGVLSHCLIIGKVLSTSNDTTFTDNTSEARLADNTAFTLFPTPATGDRTYIGHSVQFTSITVGLSTLGSAATYIWEYWNGLAWTTLSVTDGTSGFTVSGKVSWTAPAFWATTSVNGTTMYWVRVRISGTPPVTNPTVFTMTYLGWLEYYSLNNRVVYRQGTGPGTTNAFFLRVNDGATAVGADESLATAQTLSESRLRGYEIMTYVDIGTFPFPSVAQAPSGVFARKSATADTAVRQWIVMADARTFYIFALTTDLANVYLGFMFGDIFTYKSGDKFRCMLIARDIEGSVSTTTVEELSILVAIGITSAGHYMVRNDQGDVSGTSGSTAAGKIGASYGSTTALFGTLGKSNPSDHRVYGSPIHVTGTTSGVQLRGRLRGFYQWCHAVANASDGDTFLGTDTLTGRSFRILKSAGNAGVFLMETSNTWDRNTT